MLGLLDFCWAPLENWKLEGTGVWPTGEHVMFYTIVLFTLSVFLGLDYTRTSRYGVSPNFFAFVFVFGLGSYYSSS